MTEDASTQTLRAEIDLDNADGCWRPGQDGRIQNELDTEDGHRTINGRGFLQWPRSRSLSVPDRSHHFELSERKAPGLWGGAYPMTSWE